MTQKLNQHIPTRLAVCYGDKYQGTLGDLIKVNGFVDPFVVPISIPNQLEHSPTSATQSEFAGLQESTLAEASSDWVGKVKPDHSSSSISETSSFSVDEGHNEDSNSREESSMLTSCTELKQEDMRPFEVMSYIAHIPGEKLLPPPPLMREPLRSRAYAQNKALREKIDSDILALRILWADSRVCPKKFAARFRSSFSLERCLLCTQFERRETQNVCTFFAHLISDRHIQSLRTFIGDVFADDVAFWLNFVRECFIDTSTARIPRR